jgi:hypothetical protein
MSRFEWLSEFLARLEDEHLLARSGSARLLAPAHRLVLDAEDWGRAAKVAVGMGLRNAGLWADPEDGVAGGAASADDRDEPGIAVRTCLELRGDYLVLETWVPERRPLLPSIVPCYPGLDRLERHCHDLTGVVFTGQPDGRRWTRHQAWGEDAYPLRADFPVAGRVKGRTPADADYPFAKVQGSGVYEIPVGPVHAGIIEPGHFRFQAMGEEVLRLEERLGYVHKGIEKIAVGRDPAGLARLAGRVSGDSTVAHAWAACQAMERAMGCQVSPRALWLRGLMAERERIANHLGDIGAVCNDVAFGFAHVQCARLREVWQRRTLALFGHRMMMDAVVPGGVAGTCRPRGWQRSGGTMPRWPGRSCRSSMSSTTTPPWTTAWRRLGGSRAPTPAPWAAPAMWARRAVSPTTFVATARMRPTIPWTSRHRRSPMGTWPPACGCACRRSRGASSSWIGCSRPCRPARPWSACRPRRQGPWVSAWWTVGGARS